MGFEACAVVLAYLAYGVLRIFVEGGQADAVANASSLVSLEQTMGLFHEASIQRAVESRPWLLATMEWIYLWSYLPILVVAGLIMYLHDKRLYRGYRNTMFLSALVGLVIFATVPVAPPRMLPEYGFLDPLHAALTPTSGAKNDFAAVPSFHFGFTLLAGVGAAHVFRFRSWLCALLALLPAVMLLSIVSTANHFFLDAAIGGAIVMVIWWMLVWRREPERLALLDVPSGDAEGARAA
jgi:hypothetical protein